MQKEWPAWWEWEIELSPHVLKRMVDRGFNEVDLREMLEGSTSMTPNVVPGRWVAVSRWRRRRWEVVLEPDASAKVIVVVTAYPVTRGTR